MQKLVERIEGRVKSATEEGRCKPASRSRLEKLKCSGLSDVKLKCSGLSQVKLKYSGRRKELLAETLTFLFNNILVNRFKFSLL